MVAFPSRGAELAFCGAASLPLLNLVGFNCYLITENLTTAEEFHRPYGNRNPFSEGKQRTHCVERLLCHLSTLAKVVLQWQISAVLAFDLNGGPLCCF